MTNSVNKLLKALNENTELSQDKWIKEHLIISDKKKWVANILPFELLSRTVKEAVESVTEENGVEENFDEFPEEAFDETADDTEKANKPEYVPKNKYENPKVEIITGIEIL